MLTQCGTTCLCPAGKTLAENLEGVPDLKEGQQVIMPLEQPIKASGHLQVHMLSCEQFCPGSKQARHDDDMMAGDKLYTRVPLSTRPSAEQREMVLNARVLGAAADPVR